MVRLAATVDSPPAYAALENLCRDYWLPVYAFARRRGCDPGAAEDLTQAFFAELLAKKRLALADPARGRFRTFLLTSFQNFLANEMDRAHRLKRGGGVEFLFLDAATSEERYQLEAATRLPPETAFDRHWAETVLRLALERLRHEMETLHPGRYAALKDFLEADKGAVSYTDAASRLGLTLGATKTVIRRMRLRFAALVREEVAHTSTAHTDVEDELRHLLDVLGG